MKLADLMTAKQATEIIEYIQSLEKRIENLENEVAASRQREWRRAYDTLGIDIM